jgi:hypothetical protein
MKCFSPSIDVVGLGTHRKKRFQMHPKKIYHVVVVGLKETTPIETGDDDDIILWFWM